jgi:hypothetical protein
MTRLLDHCRYPRSIVFLSIGVIVSGVVRVFGR